MATKCQDAGFHTPTGREKLMMAFLASTESEQEQFVAWAQEKLVARKKVREYIRSWRDAPPPDVRRQEPARPTYHFSWFYK